MITAFVVVDKAVQIVLTPETDIDKMVIKFIEDHSAPVIYKGEFYKNDLGYYREGRLGGTDVSLIMRWEAPESSIDHLSSTMDGLKTGSP